MAWTRRVCAAGGAILAALATAYIEFILLLGVTFNAADARYGWMAIGIASALVPPSAAALTWVRIHASDAPQRALFASLISMAVAWAVLLGNLFLYVFIAGPPF